MKQYLDLLQDILDNGVDKGDRTGTGNRSVFGRQLRFDLSKGFPLVTTKKLHLKSIIYELLWFIKGDTNVKYLQDNGVRIWNEWANENGDLGPVYGAQWRNWNSNGIDQLKELVETLRYNPESRRMLVLAWNPSQLSQMGLPPCHILYQCYVANGKLSLILYQRSCDTFLGVPFNIASYALLTMMLAQVTGYEVGEYIHMLGDTHIYSNHFEAAKLQLSREPYPLPKMILNKRVKQLEDFSFEDFNLESYQCHPTIKASVSV